MSHLPPAIVILAAGGSSRMGRPKQLLLHNGKTLIRSAVETALAAAEGAVVVVLGANEPAIHDEIKDLQATIALNPDWEEGMASSIKAGLQVVSNAAAVVFMLCDQPLLTPAVLARMLAVYRDVSPLVVACSYDGVLGVPALFDGSLFDELMALQGAQGAKKILEKHHSRAVMVPFEEGSVDVDTPEQYARLMGQQ